MLQVNPFAGPTPPPVGSVGVGEILVDALTRRMWLGVAPTTDPLQALLIGDLVALQAEDADIRADFTQLLNSGLAGKSDVGHTHTASQITDFTQAVNGVVSGGAAAGVPPGCIIMYYGPLANIGVGAYAGFVLCDGQNGTPDLRNRFVMGAGHVAPGTAGGSSTISGTTDWGGTHSHGGATGWTALTVAQMPHHNHALADPGHQHYLGSQNHAHTYTRYAALATIPAGGAGAASSIWQGTNTNVNTAGRDPGNQWVSAAGTGLGMYGTGGNEAHYHTIGADGYHYHTLAAANAMPPYVAVAYIMKTY
jgi:hypothetical protein